MKILLVNTFYYPNMIGGTEQSVKLLAEGLSKKGNDVYVLTGDALKDDVENDNINGVNIIRLKAKDKFNSKIGKVTRKILELENILLKKEINNILDKVKPDIVHTNNLFYMSNIVWKLSNKKRIKVVHTLRDYWGLCPRCTLLNKDNRICDKSNILCELHKKNYKTKSKYVDIVTAPSRFTLDIYNNNDYYNNIPNKLIYNAIDINLDEHRNIANKKINSQYDEITFVFLGSLETHKGIKYLIETFKKNKNNNIRLIICGDGSLKSYVEENCKIDNRIVYKGKVDYEEKDKILRTGNIMIVPSVWYEPFGRVVIEGYKYAMPVIACNIGGIKELLNKEVSIAVDANSKEQLEEAINYLSKKENLDEFIMNTEKYIKKYDLDNQIDSFIEVYQDIK